MILSELFWNAAVAEMKAGYMHKTETNDFVCLICGEVFSKGIIYQKDNLLLEAEKYVQTHISDKHISVFSQLAGLDKKYTGLSENQTQMLTHFYEGLPDKEIAKKMQGISLSTVRNYRFFLKEKEKQARVFLALMSLAAERATQPDTDYIPIPGTATMMDERFAITVQEYAKVIRDHFPNGEEGELLRFPKKQKAKIIILLHLLKKFDKNKKYNEKEVNALLKDVYADYVTLRRYLIEYGFMDRKTDGSEYWVKQ